MRFANPLAWLGLLLLALPVAVHMLVRNRAPVQRLPTLRFLRGEPPIAIRRSRPDEPRLLLLRMTILALAVAALARPLFPRAESPEASTLGGSAEPNRAVLVDESWSMLRAPTGSAGSTALDRARELASEAAAEASASTVIPFGADLPLEVAIEGAAAWLEARPGPGEIVLVSDFQRGTLDAARGVALPDRLGRVPMPVEVETAAPSTLPLRAGYARATVGPDAVRLTWSGTADAGPGSPDVEVIYPGDPADPAPTPTPLSPEAASLLLRLASDRTLAAAAAEHRAQTEAAVSPVGQGSELTVARDRTGHPLLTAEATPSSTLRVRSQAPSASLPAAALRLALARAADSSPPGSELEPRFDDADVLASWARSPGPADAADSEPTGSRAARWAWALVLVLLASEFLYRRRIHAHRN